MITNYGVINITLKRHCDTRWSSKADVVKAISTQLDEVITALEKLRDTPTGTIDTREDAAFIINAIENFNFVTLLFFLDRYSFFYEQNLADQRNKLYSSIDTSGDAIGQIKSLQESAL